MRIPIELFAVSPTTPDALWAVVGNPRRLPEWTDAERVEHVDPEPLAVGGEVVTLDAGQRRTWRIETVAERLWEATTDLGEGTLGVGARVLPDPLGSRLILAGMLEAPRGAWRARLWTAPRLRGRFDRWTQAAIRAAND